MYVYRSTAGATAGRLEQVVGPFPSTYSPVCSGQEAKVLERPSADRNSEACLVGKVYVTCFINDPISGVCSITVEPSSTTAAPCTVSELPTTKSTSHLHPVLQLVQVVQTLPQTLWILSQPVV